MASAALVYWQGNRRDRLDRLETAHRNTRTGNRGRQWLTEELNHSLIGRLAAEFQGFCRDLHDESISALLTAHTVPDPAVRTVVATRLAFGRKLDQGNANPGNLGTDFAAVGIVLWTELATAYPIEKPGWESDLKRLNEARNALAHNNQAEIDACKLIQPLTLKTAQKWRKMLDSVTVGMDNVLNSHLQALTGSRPW